MYVGLSEQSYSMVIGCSPGSSLVIAKNVASLLLVDTVMSILFDSPINIDVGLEVTVTTTSSYSTTST
jgi:hypothetical protein